jgi:hydroxymethylpyrimidine/phosphomethylpyrimidine kinase
MDIHAAVVRARNYVFGAIRHAPGLGQGQGPLNADFHEGKSINIFGSP